MEPEEASDSGNMTHSSPISSLLRTPHSSQSETEESERDAFSDPNFLIEHIKRLIAAKRKMKHIMESNVYLDKNNTSLRNENEKLRMELEKIQKDRIESDRNSSLAQLVPVDQTIESNPSADEFNKDYKKYIGEIKSLKTRLKESNANLETSDHIISNLERAINSHQQCSSTMEHDKEEISKEKERRREAERLVSTMSVSIQKLLEEKSQNEQYITKLEQETLDIDYLRDQIANQAQMKKNNSIFGEQQKSESVISQETDELRVKKRYDVPSSVEKGLKRLTEQMEELMQGRLIHELPLAFQSEPPVDHQSGETFHEIAKILRMILNKKRVNIKHLEDVWNSIVRRIKLVESAMNEKMVAANKLSQKEVQKIEDACQKEKEKLQSEVQFLKREKRVYTSDRLAVELKAKDEKISSLEQTINNQAETIFQLREANIVLNNRYKRDQASQRSSVPIVFREADKSIKVEEGASCSLSSPEELTRKLHLYEDELVSEQRLYQLLKVTSEETTSQLSKTKKKLEETFVKINYFENLIENAASMIMAIRENVNLETLEESLEELCSILLNSAENLENNRSTRKIPDNIIEDKDWLLDNFFKKSYSS